MFQGKITSDKQIYILYFEPDADHSTIVDHINIIQDFTFTIDIHA